LCRDKYNKNKNDARKKNQKNDKKISHIYQLKELLDVM